MIYPSSLAVRRLAVLAAATVGACLSVGFVARSQADDATVQAILAAANGHATVTVSPVTGLVTFISVQPGSEIPAAGGTPQQRAQAFLATYPGAFGLGGSSDISVLQTAHDALGLDRVYAAQLRGGYVVAGTYITVSLRGTAVSSVSARTIAATPSLGYTASVTATQATALVQAMVAKHFSVSDESLSTPSLEVLPFDLIEGKRRLPRLAWFVEARRQDLRRFVWVDAITGAVLLDVDQLPDALNRSVYDDAGGSAVWPGAAVRAEGQGPTGASDVDLAYSYSGNFYNYLQTTFGRDSIDGLGAPLLSVANYCPAGGPCPFTNAFWNGTQAVFGTGMTVADDIVGHEFTHGLIEQAAGLLNYGQAGAIGESFADLFGELVNLTNNSAAVRWQIGADLKGLGPLRDMMNPGAHAQPSWTGDSAFYCGGEDGGGVHTNGGVLNHAFALMADGGTFQGKTVTGLGLDKTARIGYRALTAYLPGSLPATADFLTVDRALRQSCADLVGTASIVATDCVAAGTALDAVGLSNPVCAVAAPALTCASGLTAANSFSDDFENTTSATWTTGVLAGGNAWTGAGGSGTPAIRLAENPYSGSLSLRATLDRASDSYVAMSSDVVVPPNGQLQFMHSFALEAGYDGGVVEYSLDGGSSWQDAEPLHAGGADYATAPLRASSDNPLAGRRAFTGFSLGYVATQYDLSSFAGQTVRVRFRLGTDTGIAYEGWFIDDVRISGCSAASVRPMATSVLSSAQTLAAAAVGGTLAIDKSAWTISEGAGFINVSVSLSGATGGSTTVSYATLANVGHPGVDYGTLGVTTELSGTLTFDAGDVQKVITIPIIPNNIMDGTRDFNIILQTPVGGTLGTPSSADVSITDDDSIFQFTADSYTIPENAHTSTLVTVQRLGSTVGTAYVQYYASDGTSVPGEEYTAPVPNPGTLTFGPGVFTQALPVTVINNSTMSGDRSLMLWLMNTATSAVPVRDTTVVMIKDLSTTPADLGFDSTAFAFREDVGTAEIYVHRKGNLSGAVTVDYATADYVGTAGVDYVAKSGTLTFADGQAWAALNVQIIPDHLPNGHKEIWVTLSNPQPAAGVQMTFGPRCRIVVWDNENSIEWLTPWFYVDQGNSVATSIIRGGDLSTSTRVLMSTTTLAAPPPYNTATQDLDYANTVQWVDIPAGVDHVSAPSAQTWHDGLAEGPEAFILVLQYVQNPNGGNYVLGRTSQLTAVIYDLEKPGDIAFTQSDYSVTEGQDFTVWTKRYHGTGLAATPAQVQIGATGDTAISGTDYTPASPSLTYSDSTNPANAASFIVHTIRDNVVRGPKTVTLKFTTAGEGQQLNVSGPSTATLHILDADGQTFQFSAATFQAYRSTGVVTITGTRTGSTSAAATVDYAVALDPASVNRSFTPMSGTVTFLAGQASVSYTVAFPNDYVNRGPFILDVSLSNPSSGAQIGWPSTAVVTILDDNAVSNVQFSGTQFSGAKADGQATITVTRTNASGGGMTVDYATSAGTATACPATGCDYNDASGTLSFGAGDASKTFTVTLQPNTNTPTQPNETVKVLLRNPTGGAVLGTPSQATLWLVDNSLTAPGPREAVAWGAATGVTVSGNSLTKTVLTGWGNAGAVSTRSLASGDGYVEIVASEATTSRMVGLSNGNTNQSYTDIDFAVNLSGNTLMVYEGGASRGSFGTFATGDVIRVAVAGGVMKYSKNGRVFYTSASTPTYPLLVDTALLDNGATITGVILCGNLIDTALAVPPPSSGTGQAVIWTRAVGATVSGNNLTKTAATGWGNSGASSAQSIVSGDGYVEATVVETNRSRLFGLSNGDTDQGYADVDFAIDVYNNQFYVIEKGVSKYGPMTVNANDVLRVAVTAGVVRYYIDGALQYTSAATPTYPLLCDTALYDPGATIQNVLISGNITGGLPPTPTPTPTPTPGPATTEAVAWTATVGVTASENNLTMTATGGWGSAGAVSTRAIASGDGYVEVVASETTTNRMFGLSNGDTNQNYTDIDFAVYLHAGALMVYEGGSARGTFGSFAAGDAIRVAVVGGVVKYSKNGSVFYASAATPTYPLLVDTALLETTATIQNVVISGSLTVSFTPTPPTPTPGPVEAVVWTNAAGVTVSGNNLTKTASTGWGNSGASSTRAIASGDGYVEATVAELTDSRLFGLSNGDTDQGYADVDFGIDVYLNQFYVIENGVTKYGPVTVKTNDVLRVGITAGVVRYYINGALQYTSTATPTYPLLCDTALYDTNATIRNVVISGGSLSGPTPSPTPTPTPSPTPSPTPTPTPTPTPGPTTTEAVVWTNAAGVTVSGNNLTKIAPSGWGNSGASSTRAIASGDGYVEATVAEVTDSRLFGLSNGDANQGYADVDFAIDVYINQFYVIEAGVTKYGPVTVKTNDVLRVAVTAGVVRYYINGALQYTSTATPTYPLLCDTALYDTNATIRNVVISGSLSGPTPPPTPTPTPTPTPGPTTTESVVWANAAGVTVSGNNLTKTASTGWGNSGASSTRAIASGDGYVEATVAEVSDSRLFGLSNGDTDQGYADVDFAIDVYINQFYVIEAGATKYGPVTVKTNDVLRVGVAAGVVRYYINGALQYTSTATPTYPLLCDTALYDKGATIRGVMISGSLQ
jgi:bacillolysin